MLVVSGSLTELINLLILSPQLPQRLPPMYQICSSSLHKVKGFADDLTVISDNVDSHQLVLRSLVLKAGEICLKFQPAKCVSLHFNGHRVVPSTQFSMINGNTVNICSVNCTKFLGKTIGVSFLAIVNL